MPNIKSAKKKQKQDIKRTKHNENYDLTIKKTIKSLSKVGEKKQGNELKKAYSIIDKAAKRNIIHKNKAARLKSKISRLKKA